jgi:hypothetical protein
MVIGGLWGLSGLWSLWTLVNRIADRGAGAQSTTAEGLTTVALVIVYILPGLVVAGLGALVAHAGRRKK